MELKQISLCVSGGDGGRVDGALTFSAFEKCKKTEGQNCLFNQKQNKTKNLLSFGEMWGWLDCWLTTR